MQMLSRHPAARPEAGVILAGAVCALAGDDRRLSLDGSSDGPAAVRSNIYYWARDSAIPRKLIFETNLRIEQVRGRARWIMHHPRHMSRLSSRLQSMY